MKYVERMRKMKVCIIQPPYSVDYEKTEEYFRSEIELLEQCDDSMDIIVMPESCDIPCLAKTKEQADASAEKLNDKLLKKVSETAKRCNAMIFVNARFVKSYFNQEMIDKAHQNGIICNVFWSDDTEETKKFLDMGIDTILTNDYNIISQVVKQS